MARGRMLNQSIAEDVEFNEMSIEAQLMFLRTVPFLDRDGLINGNASVLRGKVAPLLDLPKSMASIVDEWLNAELVIRYTVGKQIILFFPGFAKNQIGMRYERETASTYPPPPGYTRTSKGLIAPGESSPQYAQNNDSDSSGNDAQPNGEQTPDDCRNIAGTLPDDCRLNGMEWNRKEEEEKVNSAREAVTKVDIDTPSAPPSFPDDGKRERRHGKVTHYDPRQVGKDGLLPKGSGSTQIEIWRESFTWTPTAAQIADMNEKATDLDKWRKVTADCAIRGFRSYPNVMDVYQNGWKDKSAPAERKPKKVLIFNQYTGQHEEKVGL